MKQMDDDPDMLEEYDFSGGVRGKYAKCAALSLADLEERAKQGSREQFNAALAKVPDVEPPDYDWL